MTVYNGASDEAENIGKVTDMVMSPEGQIEAVVIGVGGFLGIGRKDVAIEYDLVEWTETDGNEFLIVETTADALKAQQAFERAAYEPVPVDAGIAETKPATAEDLANAPVEEEAAPDDTAAAPTAPLAPANDAASDETTAEAPADGDPAVQQSTAEAPAATDDTAAEAPAVNVDDTTIAAIDRSQLQPLDVTGIRVEDFVGTTVYGADEENVGEIGDVILTQDGKIDAVLIDVGGFLGIGEKEIAVGMENLAFLTDGDGNRYLYTEWTREQLEAQPAYDEAGYVEQRDEMRMVVPN